MQSTVILSSECTNEAKILMGKNCVLCLVELNEKNDNKTNLFELCRRYLHSGLTQEFSRNLFDQNCTFCQKCSESAMKLTNLTVQLESIQKSVSDLVVMFTLDILHRRGKAIDSQDESSENNLGQSKKKLIEFDVSALPNFFCENENISVHMSSETVSQEILSENVHGVQIGDSLFMHGLTDYENIVSHFTNEEVKCENGQQSWMDETGLDEEGTTNAFLITEKGLTLFGNGRSICGAEIVVEKDKCDNDQKTPLKTAWNKEKPKNKYKAAERKNVASYNIGKIKSEQIPISIEIPTFSIVTATTSSIGKTETVGRYSQARKGNTKEVSPTKANGDTANGKNFQNNSTGKQFKCDVCSKEFKNRIYLLRHKTIHTGELPYKCDFCNRGFRDRSNMSKHIILHTGEKPFRCDQCDYASAYYSNLKSHKSHRHSN